MATSGGAANSRLCVDDWVQEGCRVLAEDGVKALTLWTALQSPRRMSPFAMI